MNRTSKEQIVSVLKEKINQARFVILTDYCGLNVEKVTSLRNELRKNSAEYRVVKNSLLRLASLETPLESVATHLPGPTAVVFGSGDPLPSTKTLIKFKKEYAELEVKGGVIEGRTLSRDEIEILAQLPPREVLLGKLLSLLLSPLRGLLNALGGMSPRLLLVLEEINKKKAKG